MAVVHKLNHSATLVRQCCCERLAALSLVYAGYSSYKPRIRKNFNLCILAVEHKSLINVNCLIVRSNACEIFLGQSYGVNTIAVENVENHTLCCDNLFVQSLFMDYLEKGKMIYGVYYVGL